MTTYERMLPVWEIARRAVTIGVIVGGCIGAVVGLPFAGFGAFVGGPIGAGLGASLAATSIPVLVSLARHRAGPVRIRAVSGLWCALVASSTFAIGAAVGQLSTGWVACSTVFVVASAVAAAAAGPRAIRGTSSGPGHARHADRLQTAIATGSWVGAILGGATGLVTGLIAYPPTAPIAAIMIGGIAAIVGASFGLSWGLMGAPGPTAAVTAMRAAGVGSAVGMVVGGVVGSLLVPFYGTVCGAELGGLAGAVVGLINVPALLACRFRRASRLSSAAACAVTCGGLAVVVVDNLGLGHYAALVALVSVVGALGGIVASRPVGRGPVR